MDNSLSIERAVDNILAQSLSLRAGRNLLILADQNAIPVADALTLGAQNLGIHSTTVYVPRSLQDAFAPDDTLPAAVEHLIQEADAIVSCLSDQPEHFAYRTRVLRYGWRRLTKVAHVPGLTLDILALADTDYDQIIERGGLLALALVLGQEIELQSQRADGTRCILSAKLQGWDLPPGISDGMIPEGSWANLPPGEVFAVPFQAKGEVAINGSLPGRVLKPGEELLLSFEAGRLVSIGPEKSDAARHLHQSQIIRAEEHNDGNWVNLAEIGIGLNPAIRSLAGIPLSDDKKAGTVHIGLGNSLLLGGTVDSMIHCDLVLQSPTLTIDGKPILDEGRWVLQQADWLLDHREVTLPTGWWDAIHSVHSSGSRGEKENGRLQRRWSSRSGHRAPLPVGSDHTASLAHRLYDLLPEAVDPVGREELVALAGIEHIDAREVPGLLWILWQYDLIRVQNGGGER